MIQHIWTICIFIGVGLMISAVVSTVDVDGRCTSIHNCHLVNDLGMTEYNQYIGFTNEWTIFLMVSALIPLTIGAVVENFRETRHEKQV